MRCELYLYWRTSQADLPAATKAMLAFQQQQTVAWPGLRARLLRRADAAGDAATLMETYALPSNAGGIGKTLRQHIIDSGDAASAPWRDGARHIEVFSEIELFGSPSPGSHPG